MKEKTPPNHALTIENIESSEDSIERIDATSASDDLNDPVSTDRNKTINISQYQSIVNDSYTKKVTPPKRITTLPAKGSKNESKRSPIKLNPY